MTRHEFISIHDTRHCLVQSGLLVIGVIQGASPQDESTANDSQSVTMASESIIRLLISAAWIMALRDVVAYMIVGDK